MRSLLLATLFTLGCGEEILVKHGSGTSSVSGETSLSLDEAKAPKKITFRFLIRDRVEKARTLRESKCLNDPKLDAEKALADFVKTEEMVLNVGMTPSRRRIEFVISLEPVHSFSQSAEALAYLRAIDADASNLDALVAESGEKELHLKNKLENIGVIPFDDYPAYFNLAAYDMVKLVLDPARRTVFADHKPRSRVQQAIRELRQFRDDLPFLIRSLNAITKRLESADSRCPEKLGIPVLATIERAVLDAYPIPVIVIPAGTSLSQPARAVINRFNIQRDICARSIGAALLTCQTDLAVIASEVNKTLTQQERVAVGLPLQGPSADQRGGPPPSNSDPSSLPSLP